jgi:2-dehydropantoate 2-reductase
MRIAVMGAGAVGCYYGGMLARAGHEVVLVARAAHVEAVRRDGLLLDTLSFSERVRLQADTEPSGVQARSVCCFAANRPTPRVPAGHEAKPTWHRTPWC